MVTEGDQFSLKRRNTAESPNNFTTVGSYQRQDSVGVLKDLDKDSGTTTFDVADGGLALARADLPTSVYVAFPGIDTQVEVWQGRAPRQGGQRHARPLAGGPRSRPDRRGQDALAGRGWRGRRRRR